ncbi:TniQ family protein [Marivita sp. XM-24bin2]|uniref:TniQ family protein n=1 Tax=Marivita sp. XM-24bin2 TaxID=2133951 RepID=UPI0025C2A272|nr:TniQ family protein [Marivita sp. XM-24bin2]
MTPQPLPDELLSGWAFRLSENYCCDDTDMLAHVKIDAVHGTALEASVYAAVAEKIANASPVDPVVVRSLTFPKMTPRDASLTAQMPFQDCLPCSRESVSRRNWRRA